MRHCLYVSESQDIRRRVLKAVIDSDGDTEDAEAEKQIAANSGLIPRYAIVSEFGSAFDGSSYSIDLTDAPGDRLRELGAGFPAHGYRAFCVVDLDTGSVQDVDTVFVIGASASSHDFTYVLGA